MKKVFVCGSHLCNHGGCLTIRREDVHVLLWPPKKPLIRCSILPSWSAYTKLLERLQGVWPKIIFVAMEMPIFYVNFSSLNYPNLNDESLGPYGWFYKNAQSLVLMYGVHVTGGMAFLNFDATELQIVILEAQVSVLQGSVLSPVLFLLAWTLYLESWSIIALAPLFMAPMLVPLLMLMTYVQ